VFEKSLRLDKTQRSDAFQESLLSTGEIKSPASEQDSFAKEIDKPNSVPDRDQVAIISLGRSLPISSCGLPASLAASHRCAPSPEREAARLLGLAPAGGCLAGHITVPPVSSYLTFSPWPLARPSVSVALLRASPRPDVIRQRALWSSDFPQTDHVRPRSPEALWRDHLNTANSYGQ